MEDRCNGAWVNYERGVQRSAMEEGCMGDLSKRIQRSTVERRCRGVQRGVMDEG